MGNAIPFGDYAVSLIENGELDELFDEMFWLGGWDYHVFEHAVKFRAGRSGVSLVGDPPLGLETFAYGAYNSSEKGLS